MLAALTEHPHRVVSLAFSPDGRAVVSVSQGARGAARDMRLAMACDLVFASERSTFEWAYAKTGLSGAESSTFFIPRLAGLRFAAEMLLLNPRLDAEAARGAGLVNRVFPVEGFDGEVEAVARRIAATVRASEL